MIAGEDPAGTTQDRERRGYVLGVDRTQPLAAGLLASAQLGLPAAAATLAHSQ